MDQDSTVSRFSCPAIFDHQLVVAVGTFRDQVALGSSLADQHAILHDEGWGYFSAIVCIGDICVPAVQVLSIEEGGRYRARDFAKWEGVARDQQRTHR
jgi:hypothetical protein